ncbi:heme A synthase [Corynebacterium hansenii]|uniref:Heme A synthase n=1 Tax=Corynebacterium hansenii TaxID=394964 RepID=A0ABV7ZQJ6_9CORY|nr:COX15/CtaA family protein [Corynebacterium hansenii]WJY99972.1 Heme A synthase [Corynebacterium hansenii]
MSDADRNLPLSFLPLPTIAQQRITALLVLIAQAGIAVTGSVVRVTGSGLGCDTWPQCHPGSFTPVDGAAPALHQAIEFGNRLLTFVLVALTLALFLAVIRAGRRKAIVVLAFLNGFGVIVQAVIGGISVLVDLKWYSVALHFLPSMLLVWLAGMVYVKIQEPDDGREIRTYVKSLRMLSAASAVALAGTLVTGTMVTGAGPHAGDASVLPEDRLQLPITELTHVHAGFMYLYLGLAIGLVFGLIALNAEPGLRKLGWVLVGLIIAQGCVGMVQYWTGVPEALVPVHVAGSGALTAVTAIVWQLGWRRAGGTATVTGSPAGDAERAWDTAKAAV